MEEQIQDDQHNMPSTQSLEDGSMKNLEDESHKEIGSSHSDAKHEDIIEFKEWASNVAKDEWAIHVGFYGLNKINMRNDEDKNDMNVYSRVGLKLGLLIRNFTVIRCPMLPR